MKSVAKLLFKYSKATFFLIVAVFAILFKGLFNEPAENIDDLFVEEPQPEEGLPDFDLGQGEMGNPDYDKDGFRIG